MIQDIRIVNKVASKYNLVLNYCSFPCQEKGLFTSMSLNDVPGLAGFVNMQFVTYKLHNYVSKKPGYSNPKAKLRLKHGPLIS